MKILSIFLLLSLSALAGIDLKDKAMGILPAPLKDFKVDSTTLSEVEKVLGKAHLVEGQTYYWEKDGFKYALKLSFNNKFVLDSLHYTFAAEKPALTKLGKIDTEKLTPYPASGKSSGRYLKLKEKNAEILIDPLSKTIYSVNIP